MEVGEISMTAPWLSLGKHAQRNARRAACHLGANQAAVHGSQLVVSLSIERIVEERHLFLLGTKVRLFDENSKHSLRFLLLMLKKNAFFLL